LAANHAARPLGVALCFDSRIVDWALFAEDCAG